MENKKLTKILSTVSIVGIFIVVGIMVLAFMGIFKMTMPVTDTLLVIGILCFGCFSSLTPARMLDNNKKSIPAYVMLGATTVTCLLWIIFIFVGQGLINSLVASAEVNNIGAIWVYTQICIVALVLTCLANLFITYTYQFKKNYLLFQGIMYLSNLIVGVYAVLVTFSVKISNNELSFSGAYLFNKGWLTVALMAVVFSAVSAGIIKGLVRNKNRLSALEGNRNEKYDAPKSAEVPDTLESKLKSLQSLRDQGLLTEEEYSREKAEVLKNFQNK